MDPASDPLFCLRGRLIDGPLASYVPEVLRASMTSVVCVTLPFNADCRVLPCIQRHVDDVVGMILNPDSGVFRRILSTMLSRTVTPHADAAFDMDAVSELIAFY